MSDHTVAQLSGPSRHRHAPVLRLYGCLSDSAHNVTNLRSGVCSRIDIQMYVADDAHAQGPIGQINELL